MDTNENKEREIKEGHHSHYSHRSRNSHHSDRTYHREYTSSHYKNSRKYEIDPTSEMERRGESIIFKEVHKNRIINMIKRVTFVLIFFAFIIILLVGIFNPEISVENNRKKENNSYYDKEKWDCELENSRMKEYIKEIESYVRDLEEMYSDATNEDIEPYKFKKFSE